MPEFGRTAAQHDAKAPGLVNPAEGGGLQVFGQLVQPVEEKRDAAGAQQVPGGVGTIVRCTKKGLIAVHGDGGPLVQALGKRVPAAEGQPDRHGRLGLMLAGRFSAVLQHSEQEQDHSPGLARARAAEQDQPPVREMSVNLVIQPGSGRNRAPSPGRCRPGAVAAPCPAPEAWSLRAGARPLGSRPMPPHGNWCGGDDPAAHRLLLPPARGDLGQPGSANASWACVPAPHRPAPGPSATRCPGRAAA